MTTVCSVVDDVSISGFKVPLSDPNTLERANEVLVQDETQSPDAVSATSQSTDDSTKDLVLHLHHFSFSLSFFTFLVTLFLFPVYSDLNNMYLYLNMYFVMN